MFSFRVAQLDRCCYCFIAASPGAGAGPDGRGDPSAGLHHQGNSTPGGDV